MLNFTIEGNMHEKLARFGEAAGEVGEKLCEAVFDASKEWMDEIKEEIADKFSEEMMDIFEEMEKENKEHEEMGKEKLLEGSIGGEGKKEGGGEGKSEGTGKSEKNELEVGGLGAGIGNALTFSNVVPNAQALFRIEEKEGNKSVELLYDPGHSMLGMLPGLFTPNRTGQKELFDSVMMAKRSTPLMGIAAGLNSSGAAEGSSEGEGGGGAGEGGGEGEGMATIARNDTIFISRALHKATYETIAEKEMGLEAQINKTGRRAMRELLAQHGF